MSAEEWQTWVDLAAAYRLVALFKWDDLVFTHISARVPGTEDQFLINPYGLMFEEITASSLVKIDLAGHKIEESPFPVNPAGFTIHSAVHAVRHDAQCVLHLSAPGVMQGRWPALRVRQSAQGRNTTGVRWAGWTIGQSLHARVIRTLSG